MNTFELNKIFGAFCLAGLVTMGAWLISLAAFGLFEHGHEEHALHYPLPEGTDDAVADGDEGEHAVGDEGEPVVEEVSLAALLVVADPAKGEKGFKKCAACHTVESGGKNKVGPNLWNIVNRPIASAEGFGYSDAMAGMDGVWDFERLSAFLSDPKGQVPGTKMAFRGITKDGARADLLAYLRSLSDAPADLPSE